MAVRAAHGNTVFLYSYGMPPLPLHPDVWWADQVGPADWPTVPTGWPALDAALPGQGWPLGSLIECALEPDALPWRLLLPALRAAAAQGPLVLIGLPLEPNVHAWVAQGVTPRRWVRVQTAADQDALWSAEQSLRCPDVALCWVHLRRPSASGMRRLQLAAAAAQRHAAQPGAWPAPWVLATYPRSATLPASVAPLRLEASAGDATGVAVHIRKRRGPPLSTPIWLAQPLPLQRLCDPHPASDAEANPDAPSPPVDRLSAPLRLVRA